MNLTFRMLQHTSSEVIIIQLQIKYNRTDWELAKLIDIYVKQKEYVNNRDEVSHCQRFHLRLALDHGSTETLILQCMSDRPDTNISK